MPTWSSRLTFSHLHAHPSCLTCSVADGFSHPPPTVVQFSASRSGFLTFWDQCTEGLSPFICPVEQVLLTFCSQYGARLSLRQPGLAEAGEWAAYLPLPSFPNFLVSPY